MKEIKILKHFQQSLFQTDQIITTPITKEKNVHWNLLLLWVLTHWIIITRLILQEEALK